MAKLNLCAHRGKKTPLRRNVPNLGNVLQRNFVFGQNGGGHAGQRGILGPGNTNGADQAIPAANKEFVHEG